VCVVLVKRKRNRGWALDVEGAGVAPNGAGYLERQKIAAIHGGAADVD
jgi:hypothetical protein